MTTPQMTADDLLAEWGAVAQRAQRIYLALDHHNPGHRAPWLDDGASEAFAEALDAVGISAVDGAPWGAVDLDAAHAIIAAADPLHAIP